MVFRSLTLCVTLLLSCQTINALKLQSPEAICRQRGLEEGTAAWNTCVQEAKAENDRVTREFYAHIQPQDTSSANDVAPLEKQDDPKSVYGIDTGFIPPFMSRGFARKISAYNNEQ